MGGHSDATNACTVEAVETSARGSEVEENAAVGGGIGHFLVVPRC